MKRQNAYALVIGIGKYQSDAVTPLRFTHADARAFADLLTDEERCGVPEENVKLLVDEEATLFAIKDAISGWLASQASEDSTAVIFFAGHGDVEPDRTQSSADALANYILPYDVNPSNLFASALSKEEFQRLVKTVRSKRSVILMDACHSGGVATAGSRKMGVSFSRDLYSSLAEGAGSTVIAAAAPNQLSWEDETIGHGVFTYHLMEAMKGAADSDGDGRITMTEVFDYLKKSVPESVRKLGKGEQTPVFKADMSEDIVLTINPKRLLELEEKERERNEAAQARIKKLNAELFTVYQEKGLPTAVYHFAGSLIEKPEEELERSERTTLELMSAMVAGHVSPDTFVDQCEREMEKAKMAKVPPLIPEVVERPEKKEHKTQKSEDVSYQVTGDRGRSRSPGEPEVETVPMGMNLGMIALSLFIPIVGVVVGLIFMLQGKGEKKVAGKRWLWASVVGFCGWFLLGACAEMMYQMESGMYY